MAQSKPIAQGIDITECKQEEKASSRGKNFSEAVMNGATGLLFVIGDKGNTIQWNKNVEKVTGYSAKEISKMNILDFVASEDQKTAAEAMQEVLTKGQASLEIMILSKPGKKTPFYITGLRTKLENTTCVVCTGIDATERKQAEEKLLQSEERYRTILETMQDGYLEVDLAGNFTFVNAAEGVNLGYSKEELIGMNYRQYQDETTSKKMYQIYNGIYKTGEPAKVLDVQVIRKDGTKALNEISIALMRDSEGNPIGFRSVSRDVTERRQMEEALRESEERFRSVAQTAAEGIINIDSDGNVVFWNKAAEIIFGYSTDEMVGRSLALVMPERFREAHQQGMRRVASTGESRVVGTTVDVAGLAKDGHEFPAELSLATWKTVEGVFFTGIVCDITERKRAAELLQRYAAELERSNEEVKNFAYIVSHDLRVPLVNLKGYTSELRSALGVIGSNFDAALPHLNDEKRSEVAMALHEDVPEALEFITNSVSRMDSFINAVLILARLGRQDLKPEPVDMNALVKTTLETMSHQIQERGIEVHVGSLPEVVADRTAMEQIIGNILSNAVKYPDSSRPCRIEVAAEANNGETLFSIQDTGRGIAQEDMDKVFAPFRRAGKQDTQGEGMGLAYVQTLVRRHGGRISCESELGKGTIFTFTVATSSKKGAHDA